MESRREHKDYGFHFEMELAHSDDLGRERLGLSPSDQVRRARVLARVDTRRCWSTLPRRLVLERSEYEPFLWQPVSASSHVVREGRIVWRIELFIDWDGGSDFVFSRIDGGQESSPASFGDLERRLPEARRWLMSLPVDESLLWNALSYALTPISDPDPTFAKLALDPETWRTIVQGDRTIDETARSRRLREIDGAWFPHVLNNALLHVLAAMANNHFDLIADFLDHPCLVGRYTRLMPHYFFAVLLEEVEVLRSPTRMAIGPGPAVPGTE